MKTFHDFCEHAYSIDKRPCPDGYKWTKKYVSCVPKGSRWKTFGTYWGGIGRDESDDGKKNGNGNGSHNGNGSGNGNSGNGNGGNGNGGGGNGGGE